MYYFGPPHMAGQKQDDQLEHTFSSYVRILDVALKTCQRRWTIGRSGESGSGIFVLAARHVVDDDDDDDIICNKFCWVARYSLKDLIHSLTRPIWIDSLGFMPLPKDQSLVNKNYLNGILIHLILYPRLVKSLALQNLSFL